MIAVTRLTIFTILAVAGILHPCITLDAQEPREPRTFHSQTQDGITVRIEKVTMERIFNEPAWLEAELKESKIKDRDAEFLRRSLQPKQFACFVSVVGDTKALGPTKITFADNQVSKRSSTKFFSPSKWNRRLPQLALDPMASGIEIRLSVGSDTRSSDLFPAQIQVQVTTPRGKELSFTFKNVEF